MVQKHLHKCVRKHVCVAAHLIDLGIGQVDGFVVQQLATTRNRQQVSRIKRFDHVVHGGVLS